MKVRSEDVLSKPVAGRMLEITKEDVALTHQAGAIVVGDIALLKVRFGFLDALVTNRDGSTQLVGEHI